MERFVKQLDFRARAFHSGTFRHEAALYALQSSAAMRPLDPSPPWLSLEPRAHGTVVCLEGLQQRDEQLSLLDAVQGTATSLRCHQVCLPLFYRKVTSRWRHAPRASAPLTRPSPSSACTHARALACAAAERTHAQSLLGRFSHVPLLVNIFTRAAAERTDAQALLGGLFHLALLVNFFSERAAAERADAQAVHGRLGHLPASPL